MLKLKYLNSKNLCSRNTTLMKDFIIKSKISSLSGGWVPRASTYNSELQDGHPLHCWQILAQGKGLGMEAYKL